MIKIELDDPYIQQIGVYTSPGRKKNEICICTAITDIGAMPRLSMASLSKNFSVNDAAAICTGDYEENTAYYMNCGYSVDFFMAGTKFWLKKDGKNYFAEEFVTPDEVPNIFFFSDSMKGLQKNRQKYISAFSDFMDSLRGGEYINRAIDSKKRNLELIMRNAR